MLKIKSENVPKYGNRLRVADESYDEYEWIIDHLSDEIRGYSEKVHGLRDSQQNRTILKKLFNAHGVEVEFI